MAISDYDSKGWGILLLSVIAVFVACDVTEFGLETFVPKTNEPDIWVISKS